MRGENNSLIGYAAYAFRCKNYQLTRMQTTDELYESLVKGYMESAHRKKVDLIQKAYNFACHAHEGALRPCGELNPMPLAYVEKARVTSYGKRGMKLTKK